jgi:hypothetical protein
MRAGDPSTSRHLVMKNGCEMANARRNLARSAGERSAPEFLLRLAAPQVRRVDRVSKSNLAHFIQITHRDQVEGSRTGFAKRMNRQTRRRHPNESRRVNRLPSRIGGRSWPAFAVFADRFRERLKGFPMARRHFHTEAGFRDICK